MNRNNEYEELLTELDTTPSELHYVMQRAEAKAKSKKRSRFFTIPLTSAAGCLLVFALLVNTSTAFATAVSEIPIIKDLAERLSFYPSLEAAVENDYIQSINQVQTKNNITVTIDSVIADEKRIDIFCSYESSKYPYLYIDIQIPDEYGPRYENYISGDSTRDNSMSFDNNDIQHFKIILEDDGVFKDNITLDVSIYETIFHEKVEYQITSPETLRAEFAFTMDLELAEPKVYEINQKVDIDGQLLTVDSLEVYPTHGRLSFKEDSGNPGWIQMLDFYVEDAKGEKYNSSTYYHGSVFSTQSFIQQDLESSFFSLSEDMKLYITGAMWLEKDMEKIPLDLTNRTAEKLPQGVSIKSAIRDGNDWIIEFNEPILVDDENFSINTFRTDNCYDENGKEYRLKRDNSSDGYRVVNFPGDVVYLKPSYSHIVELETPIEIKFK